MPTPAHSNVRRRRSAFLQRGLIPVLARYLPTDSLRSQRSRATIFAPAVVVWAAVLQALQPDASDRAVSYAVAQALEVPLNVRSGALCKARQRLPEDLLRQLARQVAARCWVDLRRGLRGRRVVLLDASTLTVADTPANREAFGLPAGVQPGCGYPVLHLAVLMDSRSGAVLAWSSGPEDTSELVLAQPLLAHLRPGDVVVADRAYGSYGFVAQLRSLGVDLIARQNGSRQNQRPWGGRDWDEVWERPQKVHALHEACCRAASQEVRCIWLTRPDRSTIKLITTLPRKLFSARTIQRCYRRRWRIETQLNQLKTVHRADFLRASKPATVAWSVGAHMLALNLLCAWRCDVARDQGRDPWELSLTGLRDGVLSVVGDSRKVAELRTKLLECARAEVLPKRPGRAEPRRVKRRPKRHKYMTKPREVLRAELVGGR